ncbi:MAG: chemotaxis protein CheW [Planctomycetota bacterium]|nr:chemotaxis protein CheW [Planctomycetota bacterium]
MSAIDAQRSREAELRILRDRARRLAATPEAESSREDTREVVRFRLGENVYAIDAHYVFATRWLHELTPVPGMPSAFLGITPHQGGVLPVVALDVLFGNAAQGLRDLHRVLVIGESQAELGLAAGKEIEMAWLDEDELLPAIEGCDNLAKRIVAGMTADGLTLLEGSAFLADERLFYGSPRAQANPRTTPDEGE